MNPRTLAVLLLGLSSGLPLLLINSTLQAWFTQSGVSLTVIGLLSFAGLPYVWKFVWAPLFDRYRLPLLGRRRGWVFVMQALLGVALWLLAMSNPSNDVAKMIGLAFLIAFLSATQDININAYSVDVLQERERAMGAGCMMLGYRVAMIVSSGFALVMASQWGWSLTYEFMGTLMFTMMAISVLSPEPVRVSSGPATLLSAVIEPIKQWQQQKKILVILVFILLYKVGDDLATALGTTFFLRELHFSLATVGVVSKTVGFTATIIGVLIGGIVVARLGVYRSLFLFGCLQALASLCYLACALLGNHLWLFVLTSSCENITAGMGTAAFLAFIMSLCDVRYAATQFALLSAIASVGRVCIGPIASGLVTTVGWVGLFITAFFAAFPALLLLFFITPRKTHIL